MSVISPFPPSSSLLGFFHQFAGIHRRWLHLPGIIRRIGTARLPLDIPGGNALQDKTRSEGEERIPPREIRRWTPPGSLDTQLHALCASRQPRHLAGTKHGYILVQTTPEVRVREIAKVRKRMTKGHHLPVKDPQSRDTRWDFGEPNLGLDETRYAEMLASVDTIIHAAWTLDFNQPLGAFEGTHIMGVGQLLEFSIRSTNHAHIHFISSVGTVAYWSPDMGSSLPEAPIEDSSCVIPNGYSESKHVAERICLEATRRSGISATVYRVGQVAGPTTLRGNWSPQEWLPTLVQTSKATGKVPCTLGSAAVDWIPVDTLSTIIVELVRSRHGSPASPRCAFFHLTNPSVQPWSSLIPAIEQAYKVTMVECGEWLSELETIQDPSPMDVMEKPALKLLPFYRGLFRDSSTTDHRVVLDTRQSTEKK